jgi:hypothetical protein
LILVIGARREEKLERLTTSLPDADITYRAADQPGHLATKARVLAILLAAIAVSLACERRHPRTDAAVDHRLRPEFLVELDGADAVLVVVTD